LKLVSDWEHSNSSDDLIAGRLSGANPVPKFEVATLRITEAGRKTLNGKHWEPPMRGSIWIIWLCLMMSGAAHGQVQFMNYGRFVDASAVERSYYIAGLFDALVTIDRGDNAKAAIHFSRCIMQSGMKSDHVADGVLRFAQTRPALQSQPLIFALSDYLISVCGDPS
jgi:hypothetical protein